MTPAISSGSPRRLRGLAFSNSFVPPSLSINPEASLLGKNPGATTFDVIFLGPNSTARFRPRCWFLISGDRRYGRIILT
jgi:hypothetical protein